MSRLSSLMAALAVGLGVIGLTAFVLGEFLVAGVAMLATSFAIYLRETRT